jgi:type II secretory ATPase GspE/PulE/Tfp pilus assembly ATPase PilB-like protein
MPEPQVRSSVANLAALKASSPNYVIDLVDLILSEALLLYASDIHLLPTARDLEVRFRIDGVLQLAGVLPVAVGPNVAARLKVLANMITYRTDIPQEGRIRGAPGEVEMRVSTFPTYFGERAVIRMFGGADDYQRIEDLGLPGEIRLTLMQLLDETSGAILFSGPAGSGKTTTLYTCLRELVLASRGGRSVMTMEDPIEVIVPGVAQSQINPAVGFDLETGLRSMLRQDPEVIAVGEIRDLATAEVALQASLTGHLVLCTFHAGAAAAVIGRLLEMGIEPYVITSGVRAIICQRLVRRLCTCARAANDPAELLGLEVRRARIAVGCDECRGTGYRGRVSLAEILTPSHAEINPAIRSRSDVNQVETIALKSGMVGLHERARQTVESGVTDPAEVRRVLGISSRPLPLALAE